MDVPAFLLGKFPIDMNAICFMSDGKPFANSFLLE